MPAPALTVSAPPVPSAVSVVYSWRDDPGDEVDLAVVAEHHVLAVAGADRVAGLAAEHDVVAGPGADRVRPAQAVGATIVYMASTTAGGHVDPPSHRRTPRPCRRRSGPSRRPRRRRPRRRRCRLVTVSAPPSLAASSVVYRKSMTPSVRSMRPLSPKTMSAPASAAMLSSPAPPKMQSAPAPPTMSSPGPDAAVDRPDHRAGRGTCRRVWSSGKAEMR